ncbi:motility hub landmark protein FimV [Oceaniserpentilla sp. 4NH20-0058]|uniref:FimV/HubP family polar landmark protein n=1 Tax=Oceaniserpentilla sp. 4NH20-0058 TaxID=3127660 RepID=UPI003103E084
MLRKLAIAIAASGAMMSATNVLALGMGDIELESALNQPLDARIKLMKAGELENWEMKPNLASSDEFEKSGVEYVFFLNSLKFEVEREESGDVFIHVTSQKAVVEPFLNFLVQVDWPNGRLLREYTLLLDPPVFTEEPVEAVAPAESDYVEEEQEPSLPAVAPVSEKPDVTQVEPEKFVQKQPKSVEKKDDVYKVKTNDTLWEVAITTRPNRSISPQQAMLAIQDLNPDAFIGGNINRLKANQVLRVPSEEQMLSRTFDEAVSEVALQNQSLTKRKAQLDATRKETTIERADKVEETRLKLVAGGDATTDSERGASGQVSAKTAGDQSRLEKELSITLENLDKSTRENQELRTRLDTLEEQINTLQRLINLKDEQMVAIQAGMAKPSGLEKPVVEAADPNAPQQDLNFADTVKEEVKKPEAVKAEDPKPVKPKALPSPVVEEAFDPIAFVMENPPILGAGLLVLLLALVGVNVARKRKEKQQDAENESTKSMLDSDIDDVDLGDDLDANIDVSEENNENEFDLGTESESLDTGELASAEPELSPEDVMGEVDVYLAYNRLEPARDLLEKSLVSSPDRQEYRTKLIEILTELGDDDAVAKQQELLSSDASGEIESAVEDVNEDFSMDFDLDEPENSADQSDDLVADLSEDASIEESSDLDFDLDGLDLGTQDDISSLDEELSLDSDLEFDMDFSSDGNSIDELSDLDLEEEVASLDDLDLEENSSTAELEALNDSLGEGVSLGEDDVEFDFNELDAESNEADSDLEFESLDVDESDLIHTDSDDLNLDDLDLNADDDVSFEGLDLDLEDSEISLDATEDQDSTVDESAESDDFDFSIDEEAESGDSLDFELSDDDVDVIPELSADDLPLDIKDESVDDISFELDDEAETDNTDDLSFDLAEEATLDLADELDDDIQLSADFDSEEEQLPEFEEGLSFDEEVDLPELTDEVVDDIDAQLDELSATDIELPTLESESDELSADDIELPVLESESDELSATDIELPTLESELNELSADDIELPTLESESDELDLPELNDDFDISVADEADTEADLQEILSSTDAVAEEYKEELPTLGSDDLEDDDFPPLGDIDDLDLDNLDSDLDFLSGTDESETKLDLARAYIDMEDQEGAKEILQEVIEEGNDQQKVEANKLLDSLA